MAARLYALCLRAFALIILISFVSSAPQHKQNAQKQATVVAAGGGPTATGGQTQTRVQDPKCLQPKEPGPCRMNLDRYYYNSQTNNCELFKFGGCRGNDNKFGFLKTCEDACKIGNPTANNKPATAGAAAAGTTNAKAPVASAGVVPKAPAPPAAVVPKAPAPAAVVNPKASAVAPNPSTKKTPVAARA